MGLLERMLVKSGDLGDCFDHLTEILNRGGFAALVEEFKSAPLATGICVLHVVIAAVSKLVGHSHNDEQVFGADEQDIEQKAVTLAVTMGMPVATTAGRPKRFVWQFILTQLIEELYELAKQWLSDLSDS